jgi:uncharacterized protein YjbI with pentapeptide repeats
LPCCKAKEYGWCKDLEPVKGYKDDQGNEYCVFHAPAGEKGVSLDEFNQMVFTRLNDFNALSEEEQTSNVWCDLAGTVFEGHIDFSEVNEKKELPAVTFFEAKFTKGADFILATFNGKADFHGATFSEEANFAGVTFSEAYFEIATFTGGAYFNNATFKEADFGGATFSEETHFSGATFKEAGFEWTTFSEGVYFTGKTFIGHAFFNGANIKGEVRYEAVDLERASFTGTDMRGMDFINCKWPKKHGRDVLYDELRLFKPEDEEPEKPEDEEPGKAENKRYKIIIKLYAIASRFFPHKKEVKKVEILYRRLKQKYKDEHNDPEVSPWHYGEKEMYRKGSLFRRYFPLSFSNLYWLSSGYGERPMRAGAVLLLLILLITLLLALSGLEVSKGKAPIHEITNEMLATVSLSKGPDVEPGVKPDVKTFWPLLLNTLKFATFQKDPFFVPKGWIGETVKIFAQILIPIQAALLALAVRNRFRR